MTDKQIKKQIQTIRQVSAEIRKSKEATLQFLIDAGILPPDSKLNISTTSPAANK